MALPSPLRCIIGHVLACSSSFVFASFASDCDTSGSCDNPGGVPEPGLVSNYDSAGSLTEVELAEESEAAGLEFGLLQARVRTSRVTVQRVRARGAGQTSSFGDASRGAGQTSFISDASESKVGGQRGGASIAAAPVLFQVAAEERAGDPVASHNSTGVGVEAPGPVAAMLAKPVANLTEQITAPIDAFMVAYRGVYKYAFDDSVMSMTLFGISVATTGLLLSLCICACSQRRRWAKGEIELTPLEKPPAIDRLLSERTKPVDPKPAEQAAPVREALTEVTEVSRMQPTSRLPRMNTSFNVPINRMKEHETGSNSATVDIPVWPAVWPLTARLSRDDVTGPWEAITLTHDMLDAADMPPLLVCMATPVEVGSGTGGTHIVSSSRRFEIRDGLGCRIATICLQGLGRLTVVFGECTSPLWDVELRTGSSFLVVRRHGQEIALATELRNGDPNGDLFLQVETLAIASSPEAAQLLMCTLAVLVFSL